MKTHLPSILTEDLKNETIDFAGEILELGIDGFMENDLVKDVPIVRSIQAVYSVGSYFKMQRFAKNVFVFLDAYKLGELSFEKKEEFFKDNKKNEKIAEVTLLRLEEAIDENKCKLLAALLKNLIMDDIEIQRYIYLSEAIKQIREADYEVIKWMYQDPYGRVEMDYTTQMSFRRLNQLSLLFEEILVPASTYDTTPRYTYSLNDDGKIIAKTIDDIIGL